ncbi:MAG: SPFH domain-containing protein [Bacteroidia bacterium]|nr:SPFH domain-containing protein [Bacteroidia bacterium]
MGLFDIFDQFINVIEWVDNTRDTLAWKFPDSNKEIKMGAQLTVRESQAAILINEGKMADVYAPGRYELTTRNMPILTTLRSWKYGFESPFKVDVYFFNTRQFTDNKWGTPTPVTIADSKFGQVEFRAFGSYNFRVTNFEVFFKQFCGTDPVVTLDEVEGTFRAKLVDKFTEIVAKMAEGNFSFVQMQANKSEFINALFPAIKLYFEGFGVEITDFTIQSITLPDELQEYLRKNTQMNMVGGDMQKFMMFQQAKSIEEAAKNGGHVSQPGMDMATLLLANNMMQNMQKPNPESQPPVSKDDIMKLLKDLGELKNNGILTEEEFNEKKKELLARL